MIIKKGLIYIARNPSFPQYIKIGKTSKHNIEGRFYSFTSLPEDFEFIYIFKTHNINLIEKNIHDEFSEFRHTAKSERRTEFFRKACLKDLLDYVKKIEISENRILKKIKDVPENKKSGTRSSFRTLNIPIGSKLNYKNLDIFVITADENNQVKYNNEQMSISEATLQIWYKLGKKSRTANGFMYFYYNGQPIRPKNKIQPRLQVKSHPLF